MHIVFLIQDCTTVGGTERVTCCLASEMAHQGHDVSIISVFGMEGKCKFAIDERVHFVVSSDEKYDLGLSKWARLKRVCAVARKMKKNELLLSADVIIAQKFFAAMLAIRLGFGKKTLIGDHFPYKLYSEPWLTLRNIIYKKAKAVVVLTESYRCDFVRHGVSNVEVVENMIPIAHQRHLDNDEKVILAVGRLAPEKGFDTLIKAVASISAKINGWRVEICGEGNERQNLEQMISDNHLEGKVILRGMVNDVATEYRKAAFGVMSSRYEGFPMMLLEAAACGLPMVSFDCPEGPSAILGNGGGMLVKNQDIEALSKAIMRMIDDENVRRKYAKETEKIVERYSPKKIYNQWMQIIEKYL